MILVFSVSHTNVIYLCYSIFHINYSGYGYKVIRIEIETKASRIEIEEENIKESVQDCEEAATYEI